MPNDGLDKYSLSRPDVKKMLKSTSKKWEISTWMFSFILSHSEAADLTDLCTLTWEGRTNQCNLLKINKSVLKENW